MPRKKKKIQDSKKRVLEYEGWKSGDLAWGRKNNNSDIIYGEIKEFHLKDSLGPAVTMIDLHKGSYHTVLVSTLTEKQPKKKSRTLSLRNKK